MITIVRRDIKVLGRRSVARALRYLRDLEGGLGLPDLVEPCLSIERAEDLRGLWVKKQGLIKDHKSTKLNKL